jgi:hypothetical protein
MTSPGGGRGVDTGLDERDRIRAGLDGLGHIEDRPVIGLDISLGVLGDLGQDVPGPMNKTPLTQLGRHGALDRGQQPGRAVADDQQRAAQALLTQIGQVVQVHIVEPPLPPGLELPLSLTDRPRTRPAITSASRA